MLLVYLQLDVDQFTPTDAHYFPESSIAITRLSEPKNYSDLNDADRQHGAVRRAAVRARRHDVGDERRGARRTRGARHPDGGAPARSGRRSRCTSSDFATRTRSTSPGTNGTSTRSMRGRRASRASSRSAARDSSRTTTRITRCSWPTAPPSASRTGRSTRRGGRSSGAMFATHVVED